MIQSESAVQDAMGEMIPAWKTFAVMWAYVADLSGREYTAADATQNAAQTRMEISYRANIVADMRVLLGSDIYNIEAVLGQDKKMLTLMCKRAT
jgi:SPP1 family predicted phage head-tail adaptor